MTHLSRQRIAAFATRAVVLLVASLLLTVVPAPGAAAQGSTGTAVIVLSAKGGTLATAAQRARVIAEAAGGRVRGSTAALGAVSVEVPAGRADAVRRRLLAETPAESAQITRPWKMFVTPNDPYFGSRQASYLDAVRARQAWDVTRGSTSVKIAIIDSGVNVNHPDLRGRVVGRYNAATGTTDVRDDLGHGTIVAGVAAARASNGVGVAGAATASILAVKVDDSRGYIHGDTVARAIVWATNNGARVINLSLGTPLYEPTPAKAVQYALSKGVSVVAAAGNSGWMGNPMMYPAAFPGVLSVGATHGSARASFSSYGSWVDVAAPGVNITGPVGASSYRAASGTSFSAPLVAGQVALLRTLRPALTPAALRSTVIASGTGVGNPGLGSGRVDFRRSLDLISRPSAPRQAYTQPLNGKAVLRWATPASAGASAIAGYRVQYRPRGASAWKTGPALAATRRSYAQAGLADGAHYEMRVNAFNRYGTGAGSHAPYVVVGRATQVRTPQATVIGSGTVQLSWTPPRFDGGSPITGYTAVYRRAGMNAWTSMSTGAASRSLTVSGLEFGFWEFRIAATTALGTGLWGGTMTPGVFFVPGEPQSVVALGGDGVAEISWELPANDGGLPVNSYVVERQLPGDTTWTALPQVTEGRSTYDVVTTVGTVRYRVAAVNYLGVGAFSSPVEATFVADAGNLSASAIPLTLGVPARGTTVEGDEDWYSFTLPASTSTTVVLGSMAAAHGVEVYDSNGSLLHWSYGSWEAPEAIVHPLAAGTYYVRVRVTDSVNEPGPYYTLRVHPTA